MGCCCDCWGSLEGVTLVTPCCASDGEPRGWLRLRRNWRRRRRSSGLRCGRFLRIWRPRGRELCNELSGDGPAAALVWETGLGCIRSTLQSESGRRRMSLMARFISTFCLEGWDMCWIYKILKHKTHTSRKMLSKFTSLFIKASILLWRHLPKCAVFLFYILELEKSWAVSEVPVLFYDNKMYRKVPIIFAQAYCHCSFVIVQFTHHEPPARSLLSS